jgi:hypothetical protein
MTSLSRAAQAVMDATDYPEDLATRIRVAAALQAAADQVGQKLRGFSREACQEIRAIAAELEAQ